MITKIWITCQVEDVPRYAAKILKPSGCGPDVVDIYDLTIMDKRKIKMTIKLEVTDERVAKVQTLLQQHGATNIESFTYQDYSEAELRAARLLWMNPVVTWWVAPGVFGGTEYDLTDACPNCRAGLKQASILYLSDSDQKTLKKTAATGSSDNAIVVDDGIRKELIAAGVTGISFGEVRLRQSKKKWMATEHHQVMIERTLPPMRGALTEDDEKQSCKECRRGGRKNWPDVPYKEADLVGMQDFNLTWEWFGEFHHENEETGQVAQWPCPQVLVTPRVYDIFRKAGVKAFDWKPIDVAP